MRRMQSLIALVLTVASLFSLALPVVAQEEELPEGVTVDVFASAVAEAIPQDANLLLLFRMTLAPGAVYPLAEDEGNLTLVEVERGTLTATGDADLRIARAGAEPGLEEAVPANQAFMLDAGDSALFAPDLMGEVRNDGTEDVGLLILEAVPATIMDQEMAIPEGIAVEILAMGETPKLPAGDILLLIGRFALEPGAAVPEHPHPGAEMGVVEEGTFAFTTYEGPALQVVRQTGEAMKSGEDPVVESADIGEEIVVEVGDALFVPSTNVSDTRNGGDGPATAIFAEIAPVGEGL
jgi:hypothetical protein